jgi:hypothetical protein
MLTPRGPRGSLDIFLPGEVMKTNEVYLYDILHKRVWPNRIWPTEGNENEAKNIWLKTIANLSLPP